MAFDSELSGAVSEKEKESYLKINENDKFEHGSSGFNFNHLLSDL